MAGLGAEGRRRVPAGAEASTARRPNSALLCTERRARGSLQLGERSGGGGESRGRPRPAGGALGLRAPLATRLRLWGARESRLLRPPRRAHCSAGPGLAGRRQGSKSGRRPSPGRRTPGKSETSCRGLYFLFKSAPRTRGGCFPTPGARWGRPGGGGGRRGPASGAFPATCQFYCCRACESLRISPSRRSARWMPCRPSPRPSRPPPGRAPRRAPGGRAGWGHRGGGRVGLGNLRERRRVAGAAATLPGRAEERVDSPTRRGAGLSCPLPARRWERVGYWKSAHGSRSCPTPLFIPAHTLGLGGLSEPVSSALGPARSG